MTDSSKEDFASEVLENEEVAEANSIYNSSVYELGFVRSVPGNIEKSDIKVSEEGVAKFSFGFLDDMQGGDSSLEPGEVKTPPPGSSPAVHKESICLQLTEDKPEPPGKQLTKSLKTVSQLEAEVCEEKVRAILELDAKRRKEEVEKRKLEAERRRLSGETNLESESKRKAKEERKRLKKLKKDKKESEKVVINSEDDNNEKSERKKAKAKVPTESEDSEGLCSSGPEDEEATTSTAEKHGSIINSAIALPSVPPLRYPPHMPLPHLLQDAFMGGFRPMNPFLRGPRPDFPHGRGGFIPRGRGGMRGRMPFQGFRPPFFPTSGVSAGQLKFNLAHGPHGIQQQRQPHTPPPNRGHSPILPPISDLQWTKCKPSISYAFKYNKEHKFHDNSQDVKLHNQNKSQSEENIENDLEKGDLSQQDGSQKPHEQTRKKDKKHKTMAKEKKTLKKRKEKDAKKSKISVQASVLKRKKKSSKSSRRKIEKIRKSYGSSNRTTPIENQQHSSEDAESTNSHQLVPKDVNDEEITKENDGADQMPNEEEIRNKVENIKREKIEITPLKIEDLKLNVKPLIFVKTEPEENIEQKEEEPRAIIGAEKIINIFAETVLPTVSSAIEGKQNNNFVPEKENIELGSVTPPLPPLNQTKVQKPSLQNALEIQKRIDKLLQQDDIKLEAIEAAKDLLMKKTRKHQSSKEKLSPEREMQKSAERKLTEETKSNHHKEEKSSLKEKPKAYKDKEPNKTKEIDKEKENHGNSSRHRDDKDKYSSSYKDKSKDLHKEDNKNKTYDKDKDKNKEKPRNPEKKDDNDKSRRGATTTTYRNPFKRSLSRDRFFGKFDAHRRTRTKSRERDYSAKRRLSSDRKRGDSSGYSSSRVSSKRRFSGSSGASTALNLSKSGDRDEKGSQNARNSKDKDYKDKKIEKSQDSKHKRKRSSSPKHKNEQVKDSKTKHCEKSHEINSKSSTPPTKLIKSDEKSHKSSDSKDKKKQKSPVKTVPKKRPLSFTQTEFLFPEDGTENDFILGDDEETSDSFKHLKSPSDKEDSPDTDDYMDNWENDEDVDLDMNSNMPTDMPTPRKSPPDLAEEDSFVTRFVNPSPPKDLLEKRVENGNKIEDETVNDTTPLTPPLDLLKKLPIASEAQDVKKEGNALTIQHADSRKPELFGMQELYDQFIKSVEASGVSIKASKKDKGLEIQGHIKVEVSDDLESEMQNQNDDPMSTSSTSASSSTSSSSSSSSSSESNSSSNSSSSSSSESSSDDSNDGEKFTKASKQTPKQIKLEENNSPKNSSVDDKLLSDSEKGSTNISKTTDNEISEKEPRTPSPSPLQKSSLVTQTPKKQVSQNELTPKSDVAKDFKKLKNLEANLSRIQMMRANYDSNDEISEELHKMEMLFLQEKKIILQKYAKNTQTPEKTAAVTTVTTKASTEFVPVLPSNEFGVLPPPPPPEEPNKIFDANREAIKLTISPMKLSSKPSIFNVAMSDETEKKVTDDKDEMDFTEKLVKPAKEVAIVKPMMETKEVKESRTRDSHRHRRSPVYSGSRDRQRSPGNFRDRMRRSTSRNRFSPQRRGRGRSLSISPPRRGVGARHATPPRRGGPGGRFRISNRRSRSRSRSPLRQFGNRRGKEGSPFRRKRGPHQDTQTNYKKFGRHRSSRSRSPKSPQTRPRSPRTPPPRRRSYSQDRYSRSPLPFKPPSPPMRRSLSPMRISKSPSRRSRTPPSPRRPRSPRSPRSPASPRSPLSPRSPDSHRYDDHRYRRESSFERHSPLSPHPQYYTPDSLAAGVSSSPSSYYYNESTNRISLDARINIVLNTPTNGSETPPVGYEGYTNYAQYGGAAYMSIPPQPISNQANNMGYYPNPYVAMIPSHEGHHSMLPPNVHGVQHSIHSPALQPQQQHTSPYSSIPTISSGASGSSSPLPANNFYYNDFNVANQSNTNNAVLKELPKAPVAVQKGNILEIVPSNLESGQLPKTDSKAKTSPVLVESTKSHIDKIASISWKDEVNKRHVKSAVMRLNRGNGNAMRSILKRTGTAEKPDITEKKKVYFEDGIYPSRDSDDEDRKLIEYKIRKKVLRLRKKRGIDIPAAREVIDLKTKLQKPKSDEALEKLPPPPPPNTVPPANSEQPIYLRPPTPVPLVYFHFDSVVHSMYVSQLEKPIPPRLLNPKCVPPGAPSASTGPGNVTGVGSTNAAPNHSPNMNIPVGGPTTKKDLTTLAAINRVSRNENVASSPKLVGDGKRESPNSQQSPLIPMNKPTGMHFTPTQTSPQMSPLHGPVIRHPSSPIGFVGMRINNFMRLPPSPLARTSVPLHMQAPPPNMVPPGVMAIRHPQYNMPPPNLMHPGIPPDANYNQVASGPPYTAIQAPPPGFQGYSPRAMNPGFFMGAAPPHTMHPPPPMPLNSHPKDKDHNMPYYQPHHHHHHPHHQHHHHHHPPHVHPQHPHQQPHHHNQQHKPPPPLPPPNGNNGVATSPQAMIAPYNVKKTVN